MNSQVNLLHWGYTHRNLNLI